MRQIDISRSDKGNDSLPVFVEQGLAAAGAEGWVKLSSRLARDFLVLTAAVDCDIINFL